MTTTFSLQPTTDSSLTQQLLAMTLGVAQTHALSVAAQLELADLMKDSPQSVTALAAATRTHLPTLVRLMRMLCHMGVFAEAAPGQFSCTPLGALLQSDAPNSVRHYALLMSGDGKSYFRYEYVSGWFHRWAER
jgi:hypothetical protein